MIAYCSKIMTASYPDLDLTHTTSDKSDEIFWEQSFQSMIRRLETYKIKLNVWKTMVWLPNVIAVVSLLQLLGWSIIHLITGKQNLQKRNLTTFSI